jgi:hypothetical protein
MFVSLQQHLTKSIPFSVAGVLIVVATSKIENHSLNALRIIFIEKQQTFFNVSTFRTFIDYHL